MYDLADVKELFSGYVDSLIEKTKGKLSLESAHRVLSHYNAGAMLSASNLIILVPKDLSASPIVVSPENRDEAVGFLTSMLIKDLDYIATYAEIVIIIDYKTMDFWTHYKDSVNNLYCDQIVLELKEH